MGESYIELSYVIRIMSDLESGLLEEDPGSQTKVVRNEFGGTETYVKCEIYGRWFWLKVENQGAYLGLTGDKDRDIPRIGRRADFDLQRVDDPQPLRSEERFKGFEKKK